MERLTKIEQLKKGVQFHIVDGDNILNYEYLCIHPHNGNYILAIDDTSQDAKKLYTKHLIEREVYIGDFDVSFFRNIEIQYHERMIECIKNR